MNIKTNSNMITEDYVSFETAKLLKEKGFDCNTNCYYIENSVTKTLFYSPIRENHNASCTENDAHINVSSGKMSAPTLQMAMKWLREVHNISIEPFVDFGSGDGYWWTADVGYIKKDGLIDELCGYNSYEEACEEAIKYCLENLI
jgi:hypothetical protein